MKRKFWTYILLFLLVIPANVEAQRWKLKRYEASFGLGTAHMFGDIAPPADGLMSFQVVGTRPSFSFDARFNITELVSTRVGLSYLRFGGFDSDDRIPVHSFKTDAFEHFAVMELSLISNGRSAISSSVFNRRGMVNNYNSSDVYIFVGFGGLLSKATAYDSDHEEILEHIDLHNNLEYGVVFPVGIGMKYSIDAWWSFGIELGYRLTFSDVIDGYWNQTYSRANDQYLTTSFKAVYKIRNDRKGRPIFSKYGGR